MSEGQFATWVEPVARQAREGRAEVVEFARSLPLEAWDEPSQLEGWTRKDVLAHLAGDTGKVSAAVMRAAADPKAPAPSYGEGEDALNARDVAERRERTIDALIAEIEADGEQWQRLLSRLAEGDRRKAWPGFPVDVASYLDLLANHDREHLEHMR